MNKTYEILMAGFGGQGILFAGKLLAYAGMIDQKQVSWLPSYGPEMRGGTANCHIIVSDEPVSAPIVSTPNYLLVMNRPSLDKFENSVIKGGRIIADSSLIDRNIARQDVEQILIPATQIAYDMNAPKLANMVIVGKYIAVSSMVSMDILMEALKKNVPADKNELMELNIKAIMLGFNY